MKKIYIGTIVTLALIITVNIGLFYGHRKVLPMFLEWNERESSNVCNITSCGCPNYDAALGGPYVAPGPSKLHEVVPMSILKEHVVLDSVEGLRHLDHSSLSRYYQCKSSVNSNGKLEKIHWCKKRKFMITNLSLVALVSFHGSGNTWLRYLLEQSTGVFTGSVYCDQILKANFPGESVVSGNVIAVKTHHANSRSLPKDVQFTLRKEVYDKAIVLVRNPFDALLSEANRRWNSNPTINNHIGLASEANFIGMINFVYLFV